VSSCSDSFIFPKKKGSEEKEILDLSCIIMFTAQSCEVARLFNSARRRLTNDVLLKGGYECARI
jgi:hypothetical protein